MNTVTLSSILQNPTSLPATGINNPARFIHANSFWKRIYYAKEKKILDRQAEEKIQDLFQAHYHIIDHSTLKRIWKAVGASRVWNPDVPLTIDKIKEIQKLFNENLIYHGPGIPAPAPRTIDALNTKAKIVQMTVNALLHAGPLTKSMFSLQNIEVVFKTHNPEMMEYFLLELQHELKHLKEHLETKDFSNTLERAIFIEFVWNTFLENVLAFLPFSYPKHGQTIVIPVIQKGKVILVDYNIEVIELSYNGLSTPMHALGISPRKKTKAPCFLIYSGTTFPAGDGFATTLLADFTPGYAVGEKVFKHNLHKIEAWSKNKTNLHLSGISLGGGLCLHHYKHLAKQNQLNKLAKAKLFNSPGLYTQPIFENFRPNNKSDLIKQKLKIFNQYGDAISKMGLYPSSSHAGLYRIMCKDQKVHENVVSSHVRAFTGLSLITIIKYDLDIVNKSKTRKTLTLLHRYFSWMVYIPLYCALHFKQMLEQLSKNMISHYNHLKNRQWSLL